MSLTPCAILLYIYTTNNSDTTIFGVLLSTRFGAHHAFNIIINYITLYLFIYSRPQGDTPSDDHNKKKDGARKYTTRMQDGN